MVTKGTAFRDREELGVLVRGLLPESNCLKTQTAAAIVSSTNLDNGGIILSTSTNQCAPIKPRRIDDSDPVRHEYGDPLSECPRMAIKTGTNYELCAPVHAEVRSVLNIRDAPLPSNELGEFAGHLTVSRERILGVFAPAELERFSGATLYLVGHYWACDNCIYVADTVGIPKDRIVLDKLTAEAAQKVYEAKGIK